LDEYKYRAFISYSHSDTRWATWLHRALESYRPPKELVGTTTARGVVPKRVSPVFRDREELPSATDLGALLRAALEQSQCQIIICSPKAAKSRWVNEEILSFKRLGREDRIFCLIVGGEPYASGMPGREDEECFPPAARFKLREDGELSDVPTEPIAADARPGKDGKQNAKLKIIAGLLAVGFDALRRREAQRRNRRLVAVASGAMGGMVITSGLAAYALYERAAAERQTVRAEAEARTAKETTKFLVDLFKVSDPSEARGNKVTAKEMLDKGAARIDRELAQQPAIQATLMDTLGTAYLGLTLYDQARPLLDRAVATRRSLHETDPVVLSESLNHLGDLFDAEAEYDAAERAYREALRLDSIKPDDLASRAHFATTLHGLGYLLADEEHYPEAEKTLRDALDREHALYGEAHPEIARTLKDLARAEADGGDLNHAIPIMRSALAMQRRLRGSEPHPDVAEATNDLALLLWQAGDYTASEQLFVEALQMERRLYGEKHSEIATGLENLASALQDKGDLASAEADYEKSLAMRRELVGEVHPAVAHTMHNLASLQFDRGETRAALDTERRALDIYRKVDPDGGKWIAVSLNTIGFWLTVTGKYEEADRDLREALALRQRLFGDQHPDVASSLTILAHLEVAQGKYRDALASASTATAIDTTALSATHWRTAFAQAAQGGALTGLGRYAEARDLLTRSLEVFSKASGAPPIDRVVTERYLDKLNRLTQARKPPSNETPTASPIALVAPQPAAAISAATGAR
jgi:tetratricopeptide (TPR) repeat protein